MGTYFPLLLVIATAATEFQQRGARHVHVALYYMAVRPRITKMHAVP